MSKHRVIEKADRQLISWLQIIYEPLARFSIFILYFYFGFLKLVGQSPASPLATALANRLLGPGHFNQAFKALAVFECIIGLLFLVPKATRLVIPLLLLHMVIVCSPLLITPHLVWRQPFVPTLEGQYILKNIAIVALAIAIAARLRPLAKASTK